MSVLFIAGAAVLAVADLAQEAVFVLRGGKIAKSTSDKKKNIYLPHLVAATALVLPRLHPEAAEQCPLGQGLAVQLLSPGGDVAVDRHGLPSSLYDFDLDPPSVLLPGKEGQSEVRLAEGDGEEAAARGEENAGDFAERPAYRGSNFM